MTEETNAQAGDQKTFSRADVETAIAAALEKETGGLKAKVDELLGEKKAASERAKEAEAARAKAAEEAARKGGDIEALEKSWAEKLATETGARDDQITAQRKAIESLTIGAQATAIAAELAIQGSAPAVERFVRDRLSVEMTDNGPIVRVLDSMGKPSAASIDDLKAELLADVAIKPLLVGSKAQGGGAAGANGGAGSKLTGNAGRIAAKVPGFKDLPTH